MTLNFEIASPFDFVEAQVVSTPVVATPVVASPPVNTERRDAVLFFMGFFALLGAILLTASTVGLAGVGMIGILGTGAMLIVCLLLTAG